MRFVSFLVLIALLAAGGKQDVSAQLSQPYFGAFVPHTGMQITTTFTNDFGRDADATLIITAPTPDVD